MPVGRAAQALREAVTPRASLVTPTVEFERDGVQHGHWACLAAATTWPGAR